jgi:hypothetical protein
MRRAGSLATGAVILGLAGGAPAADDAAEQPRSFELASENDFWSLAGTDRYYTNGMALTYGTRGDAPGAIDWFFKPRGEFLCADSKADCHRHVVHALAQQMFTPSDISKPQPLTDDRPYAGWLYLSTAVHADLRKGHGCGAFGDCVNDTLELQLGVVGPASLADRTQITWHALYGLQRPNGWANQIRTEPAFLARAQRTWPVRSAGEGLGGEVAPLVEGAAGTIAVYARGGVRLRAGYNLGDEHLRGTWSGDTGRGAFYLTGEWTAGLALHNMFLAGNTFSDAVHDVAQRTPRRETKLGAVAAYRGFRVSYTLVFRSKEFERQIKGHQYGSVTLGYTATF